MCQDQDEPQPAVNSAAKSGAAVNEGTTQRRAVTSGGARRLRRPGGQRGSLRAGRTALLRAGNFRRFYAGYSTSQLGSSMSAVALTFAVLDSGGTATGLGYVFAAGVVPQVIFMLGGGVIADRLGRRPVMLAADASRLAAQASLAAALFTGRPPIWLFTLLSGLLGIGEAFFTPALTALTADIVPREHLSDANALLGISQSAAQVIGPSLAGVLIAVTSPAAVIAIDAGTYGASLLALYMHRAFQAAGLRRGVGNPQQRRGHRPPRHPVGHLAELTALARPTRRGFCYPPGTWLARTWSSSRRSGTECRLEDSRAVQDDE